jgi:acetoin utilization protein AcuB
MTVKLAAAEIMTENPRTLRVDDPIADAMEALHSMGVRHLPVVDDHGELVGMLSDRDLGRLARQFTQGGDAVEVLLTHGRIPVGRAMSTDVAYVDAETDISEIVQIMLERKVGAVPVVDRDGQVVGIISYVDVLRAVPFPRGEGAPAQASARGASGRARRTST